MKFTILTFVQVFYSAYLYGQIKSEYILKDMGSSTQYPITIHTNAADELMLISAINDTVKVYGVQELIKSKIHQNSFLELELRQVGGSGVKLRRCVIICISNRSIYKVLSYYSIYNHRLNQVYNKHVDSLKLFDEKIDYEVKFEMGQKLMANLIEHDEIVSKYKPGLNINKLNSYSIVFDPKRHIFYNRIRNIKSFYNIYKPDGVNYKRELVDGDVASVELREREYLFIKGNWYFLGNDDCLFEI